ncbi:MAG: glycosyltransferase [Chloroflexi bacterium]|nr:glycosyltransferase [Chloroflexota bacterium]
MRVVYLADAPYIHTRRWVQHFAQLGWDVHVISFRPAEIEGATVHYVHGFERIGRARYLVHARRVRRLVASLEPDLLHAHHLTSYGFLAGLCDVHPTLVSVWGTDILEAPEWTPLHRRLTRFALARADHVTATGLRLANATLRYMPQAKPVTVVPYGVDLDRFPLRSAAAQRVPVVGTVARLSREKGLDVLVRAVAQLSSDGRTLRLLLVGDGPERRKLERLADQLGIGELTEFRGEVPHDDVPAVLAELDVFAMPSLAEGFGVAALEAAATGLPVVASDVHGIPDVVEHLHTGLLVPPANPGALAGVLTKLLDDAALRQELGTAGRAFVKEHYRWQDNAQQMERLYQDLLQTFTEDRTHATLPDS